MITDRTLYAYEQFCENYEDYSAGFFNQLIPVSTALKATVTGGALGGLVNGILAKGMAEKYYRDGALLGGVGGTLAGAGLVGAGVLAHKLLKNRKKKKPFNS